MSLAEVAAAVAAAAGLPEAARVPLERTDRSPAVWASAAALCAGADPGQVAARLGGHPLLADARATPSGWVRVRLAPVAVRSALAALSSGSGMPSPPVPAATPGPPGTDVERFEAARTHGGAPALDPGLRARRTLANPVVVVQLAHARACMVAAAGPGDPAGPAGPEGRSGRDHRADADLAVLLQPLDRVLVTEILDAPRRFARHAHRPHETAAALLAVATAYLPWWEERIHPGRAQSDPVRLLVSHAGRHVLERGMTLLGVSAPERM